MGRLFSQFKCLFCSFFPCRGFLLRFLLMGGFLRRLKALLQLFSLCGGPFYYFFLLMGGFSHYLKALSLRFSLFGGPFSRLKAFLLLFFSMWRPFCYIFFVGGGPFFHLLKAFLLLFFPMWECCFWFYGDPIWLAPPPLPKFWRGLMPACPLTPMSSMQYNHSLTANLH